MYGDPFEAEKNSLTFCEPYLLAMAEKDGKVASQFFITADSMPYMDGHGTIFGRVKSNKDLVMTVMDLGDDEGRPIENIWI